MWSDFSPNKAESLGLIIVPSKKLIPYNKKFITLIFIIGLTLACTAPVLSITPTVQQLQNFPIETATIPATFTLTSTMEVTASIPSATPLPVIIVSPTLIVFPIITFERNTNCRSGPAVNYFQMTSFLKDHNTQALGRNADSSWLWVKSTINPTTRCWVIVSNLKNLESFDYLPLIDFPPLPQAPSQLVVEKQSCGSRNIIILRWSGISGETGFHFYRNGIMLSNLKTDAVSYTDYPPQAREYLYEVESINDFGVSVRMAITIPGCTS